jgi:hypothetical protein
VSDSADREPPCTLILPTGSGQHSRRTEVGVASGHAVGLNSDGQSLQRGERAVLGGPALGGDHPAARVIVGWVGAADAPLTINLARESFYSRSCFSMTQNAPPIEM